MMIREFRIEDYTRVVTLWKEAGLLLRPSDKVDGIKLKLQRDPDLFLIAEEEHEIVDVVMHALDGRRG